jgi:hypothetical protein
VAKNGFLHTAAAPPQKKNLWDYPPYPKKSNPLDMYDSHVCIFVGYELINEPFAGNLYDSAGVLLPGVAGKRNLEPLYDKASKAIRSKDCQTMIFWEPVTWSYFVPLASHQILDTTLEVLFDNLNMLQLGSILKAFCGEIEPIWDLESQMDQNYEIVHSDVPTPSVLGPGLSQVPGGNEYRNRSVMSWHYYCWTFDGSNNNNETISGIVSQLFCDTILAPDVFDTVDMRTNEIGGGSMLTEVNTLRSGIV